MTNVDEQSGVTGPEVTGAEVAGTLSPGQILSQARERAGLTQQEIAQALHMSLTKVRALESDEFSKLNADTFIRGYLRSYAALLKVESASLIAAYEQQAIAQGILPRLDDTQIKEPSGRKAWGFIGSLLGLLVVLLLISVWFFGNQIAPPPLAPQAPLEQNLPASVVPAPVIPEASDPVESDVSESGVSTAPPVEANVDVEPSAVTSLSQHSRALDRLRLVFVEECWLEVSDAQGDVLATELQRPGSSLSLQGRAPFQVKLGNASAATVIFNDEPVEIKPPLGSNVITLSVGQ